MSQVLYRKWRPRTFTDVVGQPTTIQTLQRAVESDRVAHAYLFCGPRGTGKTSTARILAKAINCLSPRGGEPDNACSMCTSIDEGRALDLVEIDAASNRGIDDIRNLRERVQYTPAEARVKVYIVDEAHMLTEQAFNALLKTLEEPPAHVAFVLATTEAHKIPPTIASRCQRFDFRRIRRQDTATRLSEICAGEGVEADMPALDLISRTAGGGLRDAVNLLEQAIVSYDPPIKEANVRDLLDMGGDEASLALAVQIIEGRTADALRTVNEVAAQGSDLRQLHRGLVERLRATLLVSSGADLDIGYTEEESAQIGRLARAAETVDIVRAVRLLTAADMRLDPSSTLTLELAIVEAGLRPEPPAQASGKPADRPRRHPTTAEGREAAGAAQQGPPGRRVQQRPPTPVARQQQPEIKTQRRRSEPAAESALPSDPAERLEAQWEALTQSLRYEKGDRFNLKALLVASNGREVSEDSITLRFPHPSHQERMQHELGVPDSRRRLKDAFARVMGRPYDVRVEAAERTEPGGGRIGARGSQLVRAAQAMGAEVVAETAVDRKDSEAQG